MKRAKEFAPTMRLKEILDAEPRCHPVDIAIGVIWLFLIVMILTWGPYLVWDAVHIQ